MSLLFPTEVSTTTQKFSSEVCYTSGLFNNKIRIIQKYENLF
jgi:hypothetical protein